jgi:4-amino-4-deoxy-L-arabinose transferase-like glycosyltransferase
MTDVHSASSIILSTGKPVIVMGGFTGSDPAMTVTKLQGYVKEGALRYLLLGDGRGGSSAVTAWVQQNCTTVKASEYGGTSTNGTAAQLYRCGG